MAKDRGKGLAFDRNLRVHARYFEETTTLRPSQVGIKVKLTGLLDDERVMEDVRAWLRTLSAGTVRSILLQLYKTNSQDYR